MYKLQTELTNLVALLSCHDKRRWDRGWELTLLPRIAESANKKVASINIAGTFDIQVCWCEETVNSWGTQACKAYYVDAGNKCNKWEEFFGFKTT